MNKTENVALVSGISKSLGAKIRAERLRLNMKITEIAELTGLTASTISQVERALISPSISTLKKICDAMQIPIGILFEDSRESKVPLLPKFPTTPPPTQAEPDATFSLADIM
jgi:transcriptional regulator with XRE-family HTH domain